MRTMIHPIALSLTLSILLAGAGCDADTKEVDHCGDGYLDPGEACDGAEFTAPNCQVLGFYVQNGPMICRDDCTIDLSPCALSCGDGVISTNHGEDCEGDNLNGRTCASQGFGAGTLACNAACTFDVSGCQVASCGNGQLQSELGEDCDGTELGEATCESAGFPGGGTLACDFDCSFDTSGCRLDPCGNGVLQPELGEDCDGAELGGATCASRGRFGGGTLGCTSDCAFDTGACRDLEVVTFYDATYHRDDVSTNRSEVSKFHLAVHEVTRELWIEIMGTDPSDSHSTGPSDPVQNVNWYQAIAFCNKLSLRSGLLPVYYLNGVDFATLTWDQIPTTDDPQWNTIMVNWGNGGYRLPTVSEWTWAAMAPVDDWALAFSGSDGMNAIGDFAVFGWDRGQPGATTTMSTSPVGSKLPNAKGLYDMSGNVAEWCHDWASETPPTGYLYDYRGPASGTERTVRGGSWFQDAASCAISAPASLPPASSSFTTGLRVVLEEPISPF